MEMILIPLPRLCDHSRSLSLLVYTSILDRMLPKGGSAYMMDSKSCNIFVKRKMSCKKKDTSSRKKRLTPLGLCCVLSLFLALPLRPLFVVMCEVGRAVEGREAGRVEEYVRVGSRVGGKFLKS